MSKLPQTNTAPQAWQSLRQFTDARIGLGRSGVAQPLAANMDFKLSHARARDAVHTVFRQEKLVADIAKMHPAVALQSRADERETYLTRPDLGRLLSEDSETRYRELLQGLCYDLCLVVGDGLSARAIHENALPFIEGLLEAIEDSGHTLAPIPVVKNARVAVADPLGELCAAKVVLILIGERPGLSSPDSMGLYLTYAPKRGCTDEKRNCISNIRRAGLPPREAVRKACYLIEHAIRSGFSGIRLKDNMDVGYLPFGG